MIRNIISQMLPPGITDANLEIFADGTKLMVTFNGATMIFEQLPDYIKSAFEKLLDSDKPALEYLSKEYSTKEEMLYQYVWCNFGGWNMKPDLDKEVTTKEYWDCGCRGKCKAEGIVCNMPFKFRPRELEYISLCGQDLADKQIADKMNISNNTATTYRQNITKKLPDANSKVGIAKFAIENNLPASLCCLPKPPVA